jgi:RimJ/RimL family protein N-acetyltransferase
MSRASILTTARLRLRPLTPDDLDGIFAFYGDAEVMRYIGNGQPRSRDEARERLDFMIRCWDEHGYGMWAVEPLAGGAMLGRCGFLPMQDIDAIELGYTFRRDAWGFGYATESARVALNWAFADGGLARVICRALPANVASTHVMEKLGLRFEREGESDHGLAVWYAMDREGWSAG